jgi:hypothetical protein
MKVILKKAVVVVTIGMMAMLQSCSSNDYLDGYTPTNFNVGGKVEKGPFVRGTAIQMQPLDADLDETGESFTSTITDNEGTFTFGSKLLKSPYVKLSASGYYFNEVTGELSKGTLALNAVANLQNAADVNLNILSHLKYQRVMDLVAKDGKSFKEANNQAQEEVLKTFGLEKYAKTDVNHFSITSGTDEAAALIAVSSLILYNRSEAQITEYLSQLSEEFAEDGNFSETTKLQIRKDMFSLESKLPQIAENIKKRYQEMGKEVAVKNLIYYFDWDGDGTAGNEIAPENHPVSLETNNINVPMEGGSYEVKVNTTVPVYLERPSIPGDDIYDNSTSVLGMKIYETGSGSEPCINYSKELNNNILKVVVKAASFRKEQAVSIPLYDGMGNVVARLNLTQQANPNAEIIVPRLGSDGISCVSEFMKSLANAVTLEAQMNYRYTKIINDPSFVAPIRSSESNIHNCYINSYQALNMIARLYRADAMYRAVYSPYLNVYRDMCYYQMLIWWGGVVVVPNAGFEGYADSYVPRTSESSILQMLEEELVEAIRNLDEKKCVAFATNANDALFVSKDVARILLAKVYMYQQKWAAASNLLQQVVDKNIYSMEKVPTKYTSENKDLILALKVGNESRDSRVNVDGSPEKVVPIMTTTDVKLLYAECEIHLGNNAKASKYISEVDNVNGISGTSVSVEGIKQLRKSLKLQDYFAFLKRNGLAMKELGLEKYQLLLPIPQDEINANPSLNQNPGY